MVDRDCVVVSAEAQLVQIPVDPPRGDAIQQFAALEVPIVELTDRKGRKGIGFGYTIGSGGTAILVLIRDDLLPALIGEDALAIPFETPGHGIEFDRQALEQFTVRSAENAAFQETH